MLGKQLQTAAAGSGAAEGAYIEDLFSTSPYSGTGSTQTITNGIDLAGEGGLLWLKKRNNAASHYLADTVRGNTKTVFTNGSGPEQTNSVPINSFNSDGFTIGADSEINSVFGHTMVSWTFRKAPGFFDVVTWTGDGTSSRNISHALGSTPGFIAVKRTDSSADWWCWHRSISTGNLSGNNLIRLNSTSAQSSGLATVLGTASSTTFEVGSDSSVNASSATYVAYVFAHDDQIFGESGSESVIQCGSYAGTGSAGNSINLGWEPQWVLIKRTDSTGNWQLADTMRGIATGGTSVYLQPNLSNSESSYTSLLSVTATGFQLDAINADWNASGGSYIYIAIRRGPMKTPTDATEVFYTTTRSGTGSATSITAGFAPDMWMPCIRSSTVGMSSYAAPFDKLRGPHRFLRVNSTGSELNVTNTLTAFTNTGVEVGNDNVWMPINGTGNNYVNWAFRRAPGFFDVVAYTGTGSSSSNTGQQDITHNLGVVPELILVKGRDYASDFTVYNAASGAATNMRLNRTNGDISDIYCWDNTTPTSSVFRVGAALGADTNLNTKKYIAYLFATLDGVSKVGSYTGTGSTLNIDCGFSAGARFVMIKRTDSTGDWYVWDTARGIVSGNDPYLLLNSSAAEITYNDFIDPYTSGFTVTSTAPVEINASGGTYIFLAIA